MGIHRQDREAGALKVSPAYARGCPRRLIENSCQESRPERRMTSPAGSLMCIDEKKRYGVGTSVQNADGITTVITGILPRDSCPCHRCPSRSSLEYGLRPDRRSESEGLPHHPDGEPLEAAALFHHRRFPLGCVIIKGLNRFRRIPSGFVSTILQGYIQVAIFNNLPAVHPS